MKKLALIFLFAGAFVTFGADTENAEKKNEKPKSAAPVTRKPAPAKKTSSYSRLCEKPDMIGFWKVVKWTPYFHIPAKEWNKPVFMKYQWYIFSNDNKIKNMSAHKDNKSEVVGKKLSSVSTLLRFDFLNKGLLKVTKSDQHKFEELWRCALVIEDISVKDMEIEIKKGDVLMSLLGKNNEILYVRQIRRVEDKNGKQKSGETK